MNIVIFSNGNSIFTFEYIKNVVINYNDSLTLITVPLLKEEYINYYKNNNVKIIIIPSKKIVRRLFFFFKVLKLKLKKKDIVHVHYPTYKIIETASFINNKNSKLIVTFWGGDLFLLSNDAAEEMCPYLNKTNYITLASDSLLNKFLEFFPDIDNDKIKRRYFGSPIIPEIENLISANDKEKMKRDLQLSLDKKILVLAHNGQQTQQHPKIIEALTKCSNEIKDKFQIILPLQGVEVDESYIKEIVNLMDKSGFGYRCYYDRFSNIDVAKLRICADVFINAQSTDALSASMLEHLYTDTVVINGSWLKYQYLDDNKIKYYRFNNFDDLPNLLDKIKNLRFNQSEHAKIAIENILYWPLISKDWHSLYEL